MRVEIIDDLIKEQAESFSIEITEDNLPTGLQSASPAAVSVVIDDDEIAPSAHPYFRTEDISVNENVGTVEVQVALDRTPSGNVSFPIMTIGNTTGNSATEHDDYRPLSTNVTFEAGATGEDLIRTVSIDIIDDTEIDAILLEAFAISFGPGVQVAAGKPQKVRITIVDNDVPVVSFATAAVSIGEVSRTGAVTMTLQLDHPLPVGRLFHAYVETADQSAVAGSDYRRLERTQLLVSNNQTQRTVNIDIIDDRLIEAEETFTINLVHPITADLNDATIGTQSSVTVTIISEDIETITAHISAFRDAAGNNIPLAAQGETLVTVDEDIGTLQLTLQIDAVPTVADAIILYSIEDYDTSLSADYTVSGELTNIGVGMQGEAVFRIGTSELTQTIEIAIIDDAAQEENERFGVRLAAPINNRDVLSTGVQLTGSQDLRFTITDNDVLPGVSFSARTASVRENAGTVSVTVQLSATPSAPVTIQVRTTDGTATAGEDYRALTTEVMFAADATGVGLRQTVSIPIIDNSVDASDKAFTVAFGTLPDGIVAGVQNSVTVTIVNDDVPVVSFVEEAVTVNEDAGTVTVTVQLSRETIRPLVIPVRTRRERALPVFDYAALVQQNVVFAVGASGADLRQTVSINIIDDELDEEHETFVVTLGTLPSGVAAGTPDGVTVTITDNDVPAVSFTVATASVSESAGTVAVTVQLSTSPATPLTIPVITTNGTATAAADYTALTTEVVFYPDSAPLDLRRTIRITVADDALDELDETFTVAFGTLPSGVTAGTPDAATVTITDNDVPAVSFMAATTSVSESAGTVAVTVQLSTSPATRITIPVSTMDGTALAGVDYTALTQDVVFAAGASGAALTQTISIDLADDVLDETNETFTVAFGTLPDNVTAGTPATATVTITDDDERAASAHPYFYTEGVSVNERCRHGGSAGRFGPYSGRRCLFSGHDE